MNKNVYAIILCGGSGSRLWPRSRSKHPKHLLKLNGGATLVQETVRRLKLPLTQIYCITEASHADLLKRQLPKIPENNIIVEPDRRGTASAVALAIEQLRRQTTGDPVVISLHADSLIRDRPSFMDTVEAWVTGAQNTGRIINLGIRPTYPSTGLGYINVGERISSVGDFDVFVTKKFVEKPNQATATIYFESGRYLWNSGMFGARLSVLTDELSEHLPRLSKQITKVADAVARQQPAEAKRLYLALPNQTIDTGLLEKSKNLGVIPASFAWADIGSWADLHDVLEHDAGGNVAEGEFVDIDTKDCFIYSPDQLVATIGLENLVIINTKDAVLICPKDRSQDVKKVVEKLKARGQTKFL